MLINPTWLLNCDLADDIRKNNPGFIICHSFVDPVIPEIKQAVQASGIPYVLIGNYKHYRLDFWAMVCDLHFQSYTQNDLILNSGARKFMCLNRKPHLHRRILVHHLQAVKDLGYLTVGADPAMADGDMGEYPIPNDIYTLGDLADWRNAYLNIVTETEFKPLDPDDFFISEKTWKPILGLRPFMVYGQPKLREYLKANGFDIFEDLVDYSSLTGESETDYADLAIRTIHNLMPGDYPKLLPRLHKNRDRFRTYVYEQWNRLLTLNLND